MKRSFVIFSLVVFFMMTPRPVSAQCETCGKPDDARWCGTLPGIEKSHCNETVLQYGHPIEESNSELKLYIESLEKHLRNQSRFTKLLRRLFFELREGEAVACFFRVDELGVVFGEMIIVCNHSQVSKAHVRSAFCSAGKFPKPPNLWPKQVGMVASFVRKDGLIQFGLVQAPADNVRVGKFTGVGETILEHYLWTPEQRKLKQKPRIRFVPIGTGCLQSI